jgi:hypothetical protein
MIVTPIKTVEKRCYQEQPSNTISFPILKIVNCDCDDPENCPSSDCNRYVVGKNDLALMKKLSAAGTDHSKFMRMINATCDITAPLYWWKEMDTYKVGTVRNSCSTMHTITDRQFTKDDFSCEYAQDFTVFGEVLHALNRLRELYIKSNDKAYWYALIQLLPASYNQRATWSANYAVLRNIYHARKDHRLTEWVEFCRWIETLPYSELITLQRKGVNIYGARFRFQAPIFRCGVLSGVLAA